MFLTDNVSSFLVWKSFLYGELNIYSSWREQKKTIETVAFFVTFHSSWQISRKAFRDVNKNRMKETNFRTKNMTSFSDRKRCLEINKQFVVAIHPSLFQWVKKFSLKNGRWRKTFTRNENQFFYSSEDFKAKIHKPIDDSHGCFNKLKCTPVWNNSKNMIYSFSPGEKWTVERLDGLKSIENCTWMCVENRVRFWFHHQSCSFLSEKTNHLENGFPIT